MKRLKKFILVLCVSLFTITTVNFKVDAKDENTSKEEVVYINLNSDGSVDNIDVVNIFDLSKDQTIIDYGKYTSVSNMNTNDSIVYENNKVSINASKGKVYYEGKLDSKNIPWNFNIKYSLDGKTYSADEIAGKSGKLKIDISIKQNKAVDESFFKAYALQVTLTLDTNKASDIVADGATLANVGSDKQITYTILPDTEKDLTLTANVVDFEMDAIAINGVRMNLDVDMDTSKLKDKVSDIKDAANDLNDGAKELNDAVSNDLTSGANDLNDGANSLKDGVNSAKDGANTLNDSSSTLVDGASQLKIGIGTMKDSLSSVDTSSISTLVNGSAQFKTALNTGVSMVTYDNYKAAINQASGGQLDVDTVIGANSVAIETLTQLATQDPENAQIYSSIAQSLTASNMIMNDASSSYFSTLSSQLQQYNTSYEQIDNGINEAASSLSNLPTLIDGVEKLYTGADNLYNGLVSYTGGVTSLKNGLDTLSSGASDLANGTGDLKNGISDLNDGTNELYDGTKEFKDETGDIDSKIDDEIDDIKSNLTGSDYKTISFVSSDNVNIESVQFVIQTKEIKKLEAEEVKVIEDTNTSFWDKFLDLFR